MNAPAGESFLQHDEVDYKIAVIPFFSTFFGFYSLFPTPHTLFAFCTL